MKSIHYLILSLATLTTLSCSSGSALKFDTTTLEMGELTDNETLYPVIKVHNSSSEPIVIDSLHTSTSTVIFTGTCPMTVAAGDTAYLEFAVQTDFIDGEFATLAQLYAGSKSKPSELIIKGHVKASPKNADQICTIPLCNLLISKRDVNFSDVPLGKKVSDTIMVYNPTTSIIPLSQLTVPGTVKAKIQDRRIKGGNVTYIILDYQCNDVNLLGINFEMVKFNTGAKDCPNNAIVVQANVVETFDHLTKEQLENSPVAQIDNPEHNFGKVKHNQVYNHDFKLTNQGKTPLVIRAVNTTCGCTVARLSKKVIAPNETITITAQFDTKGREGMQQKAINLITNAPNAPNIKLWVLADIE